MSGSFSFKVYVNLGYTAHTIAGHNLKGDKKHLKQLRLSHKMHCKMCEHTVSSDMFSQSQVDGTKDHKKQPVTVEKISGEALWGEGKVISVSVQLHPRCIDVDLRRQESSDVHTS